MEKAKHPNLEAALVRAVQGGCSGGPMMAKEAAALRAKVCAVEAAGEDTRPDIAGYVLPWRIDSKSHEDVVLDADGDELMSFSKEHDSGFWEGIVKTVNRVDLLESALITAFSALEEAVSDASRDEAKEQEIVDDVRGIIILLGLRDRLPSPEASRS